MTTKTKDWYSLSDLKVLTKELKKLQKKDKELYFQTFSLILQSGVVRFANYLKREGKKGMIVTQNAAKWINNPKVENFRNKRRLRKSFQLNQKILGKAWYGKNHILSNEKEYLQIIREIISHPYSKRVMWAAPTLIEVKPRLGYLFKRDQLKPILVIVDEEGFIEHAQVLEPIWQKFLMSMDCFFKIDAFSDEFFNYIED
ncbi:hypothetical protein J7K44_00125 [bacterium]|nr:hypothetical protein [bacterium]